MMTECTVEMGSLERPTRFQVNPVGGSQANTVHQNGNGGSNVTGDSVGGEDTTDGSRELYRRIPDHDVEANECDTFREDAANLVTRRQSR